MFTMSPFPVKRQGYLRLPFHCIFTLSPPWERHHHFPPRAKHQGDLKCEMDIIFSFVHSLSHPSNFSFIAYFFYIQTNHNVDHQATGSQILLRVRCLVKWTLTFPYATTIQRRPGTSLKFMGFLQKFLQNVLRLAHVERMLKFGCNPRDIPILERRGTVAHAWHGRG